MKRTITALASAMAFALLLSACSTGGTTPNAKATSSVTSSVSPRVTTGGTAGTGGPRTSGSPSPIYPSSFSNPRANADFSPPPASRKVVCPNDHSAKEPDKTKSWVVAYVNLNSDYGSGCPDLAPGQKCRIPFSGGWQLKETPYGSMVFQVFENESNVPIRSPEVGPIPNGGQFSATTRLDYTPSAGTTKATFRVLMKDQVGRVVAQSDPQTIPIPEKCG